MDLFAILDSLRRHWLITSVVVALTMASGAYLVLAVPKQYEAIASYVLVNPAPGPTEAQIASDPALADVNRNNPYLRFSNQSTVSQVLSARVSSDAVREALIAAGADMDYTIAPSADFGGTGYIIDIVGTGSSPDEAVTTLELVTRRMQDELRAMQRIYGADDSVLITSLPVAEPTGARMVFSGTARSLVGIGAAGVIALFAAISMAEGRMEYRRERARPTRRHGRPPASSTGSTGSEHVVDRVVAAARPRRITASQAAVNEAPAVSGTPSMR